MRVLCACEYSATVRQAFTARGHYAMSCDLLPSDVTGEHYQGDVRDILNFGWDLMIAHPPCTYLSTSGIHWTSRGIRDKQLTEDALDFVQLLMSAPIERIAIENPVSVISNQIRKPDQVIQPWQFGEDASKKTCLWLKNLPPLQPTQLIAPRMVCCGRVMTNGFCADCFGNNIPRPRWGNQMDTGQSKLGATDDRWQIRSKTFQGIAEAMATQWGN